jgi:hypothetical protein
MVFVANSVKLYSLFPMTDRSVCETIKHKHDSNRLFFAAGSNEVLYQILRTEHWCDDQWHVDTEGREEKSLPQCHNVRYESQLICY